jgi:hypothetical protein
MHFEYRYLYLNKSYLSFHRRYFRNQPIRNKNFLWRPCLLMDRDEMSNFYRGPSIDASYQISVHLGKRFQRRRFFLEINQSETRFFLLFEFDQINSAKFTNSEIFYNCQNETYILEYILKLQVIILISRKLVKIKPSVIPNLKSNC